HVESARARQRDVQDHDVPLVGANARQGARAVARFAERHRLQSVDENLTDAVAHHGMLVHEQDPDHRRRFPRAAAWRFSTRLTLVPFSGVEVMVSVAPIISARSCMPSSPSAVESLVPLEVMPRPSSWILTRVDFALPTI